MEKKEFYFYQDVKVTCWVRQHFAIEAESKEEALKLAEQYKAEDVSESDECYDIIDTEYMTDTQENLSVEENGGSPTIELYDSETKKMIGNNANG